MNKAEAGMVLPIVSDRLSAVPGLGHGFFTREGGVSRGVYASLNIGLGSDDVRQDVLANRERVAAHLGVKADRLLFPHQYHSAEAVTVGPGREDPRPRADAVVTARPGVAVAISTADCGPVLFADGRNRVIAAAHAGWRGALGGILEATVEAMEAAGALRRDICAVLGPTISARNYEVGPEFVQRFLDHDPDNRRFFKASAKHGHAYFNLPLYILERLKRIGVGHAEDVGRCTYGEEQRFFSYRRATHRGEQDYGRLSSAIVLRD